MVSILNFIFIKNIRSILKNECFLVFKKLSKNFMKLLDLFCEIERKRQNVAFYSSFTDIFTSSLVWFQIAPANVL